MSVDLHKLVVSIGHTREGSWYVCADFAGRRISTSAPCATEAEAQALAPEESRRACEAIAAQGYEMTLASVPVSAVPSKGVLR